MNTPVEFNKKNESGIEHNHELSQLEIKRIKQAIERPDTEKFLLFTRLMRIHIMLKNAVITIK